MRSEKGNREYEEHEEDVSNSNRDGPSSNTSNTTATGNTKDKNNDKANAIRSKHSVTEQRRRSKINERFQILRDLVPHGDQKRDTASFLLEVIDYVKHLQEKVQKYEGSYPGWSLEPAKLMPWRNTHWHVQTFAGQSHATKSGPGPVSTFPGKFEENNAGVTSNVLASAENAADAGQEVVNKSIDLSMLAPIQSDDMIVHHPERPAGSDLASTAGPLTENLLNQPEDLSIEGGTISISSMYSQGENIWLKPLRIGQMVQGADRVVLTHLWFRSQYLIQGVLAESFLIAPIHGLVRLLNSLTDALQSAGVDLSQASISVQIDLGKRANRGHMTGTSIAADQAGSFPSNSTVAHTADAASREEGSDEAQKRQKT